MHASLNQLLPIPLESHDVRRLQELIFRYRSGQAASILDTYLSGQQVDGLGGVQVLLQQFFESGAQPKDRLSKVTSHWSSAFLLTQLMCIPDLPSSARQQLNNNLAARQIRAELENATPPTQLAEHRLDAAFLDLRDESVVHVSNDALSKIWNRLLFERCGSDQEPRSPGDGEEGKAQHPDSNDEMRTYALPRLESWDMPVIPDSRLLGIAAFDEPDAVSGPDPESGQTRTPSRSLESLERAYDILAQLWPDILTWVQSLVPAFSMIAGSDEAAYHRSATLGPGGPIFLSPVNDGFTYAEDIVHELQHQRFFLLTDTRSIKSWSKEDAVFASPYRTDPRPLLGLHIGLHAFLAVNHLRLISLVQGVQSPTRKRDALKSHVGNLFAFGTIALHEEPEGAGIILLEQYAVELLRQHDLLFDGDTGDGALEQFEHELENKIAKWGTGRPARNGAARYRDWSAILYEANRIIAERHGAR